MQHSFGLRQVSAKADVIGFRSRRRAAPLLGDLLISDGALTDAARAETLKRQAEVDARFGDILLARRLIDRTRLYAAIARQHGVAVADLDRSPPPPELVADLGADTCLRFGLVPWRRDTNSTGPRVLVATSRPDEFEARRPLLERHLGAVAMAVTGEIEVHRAVARVDTGALIARAETRVAAAESCRDIAFSLSGAHPLLLGAAFVLLCLVALFPQPVLQGLTFLAIVTLLANSALKCAALLPQLIGGLSQSRAAPPPPEVPAIPARLPRVSLLVPLYKERAVAARLIHRLNRLDYPTELLEICLVIEADDTITRAALDGLELPMHMRCITVPAGPLKTKPRALNYALDFCRGTLVGIYDAEDAPEPDQILRVVDRFRARGPDLACVQATLDFYNSRSNWLARCFAVEYAAWFRVVLPGMVRLGLVAPLGGTSLFFRREVLDRMGGWDAHNVTEDADLGVRLARYGYRTEFIDSVTHEEANCHAWPWIRQRSRWLKGYMMTWAVHMRSPLLLFRQLGPWRFAGVQLLFLGTISQFLLAPFLWMFWLVPFGVSHPFAPALGPGGTLTLLAAFLLSEVISLAVGLFAVRAPEHRHLMPWVLTMHFYFPLAALAAYKGLIEVVTRPFYWDKTTHGIYGNPDEPRKLPAPARDGAPDTDTDAAPGATRPWRFRRLFQPGRPHRHRA